MKRLYPATLLEEGIKVASAFVKGGVGHKGKCDNVYHVDEFDIEHTDGACSLHLNLCEKRRKRMNKWIAKAKGALD